MVAMSAVSMLHELLREALQRDDVRLHGGFPLKLYGQPNALLPGNSLAVKLAAAFFFAERAAL